MKIIIDDFSGLEPDIDKFSRWVKSRYINLSQKTEFLNRIDFKVII